MARRLWPTGVDWLLLVGWMGVIFYWSNQVSPNVPGVEIGLIRKLMHVTEFVLLFALWWRALHLTWPQHAPTMLRLALAATILYAASDELHQHFVGRDGNVVDVLIDSAMPSLIWFRLEVRRTKALLPLR
ncbi:MAG: VanZ family protein [Chloroflexota bacterium]